MIESTIATGHLHTDRYGRIVLVPGANGPLLWAEQTRNGLWHICDENGSYAIGEHEDLDAITDEWLRATA